MEFSNKAQEEVFGKVREMAKEIFGRQMKFSEDSPTFAVFVGSTLTVTSVYPWKKNDAVIGTRSFVVRAPEIDESLMRFLLEANAQMIFGAFGIDKDGDIIFENNIYGPTATLADVEHSILATARTADEYDDQIVSRWGGQTWAEHMANKSS